MNYFVIDIDGFIIFTVDKYIQPPNSVAADVEIGEAPGAGYLYHYASKEWVEHPDQRRSFSLGRQARAQRNDLLQQSDWTQLPDVPLPTKQAWTTYRQALRNITLELGFPFDITWPTPPA